MGDFLKWSRGRLGSREKKKGFHQFLHFCNMLLDTWNYMTHIFWSWQIKRSFLESKGRPEERTSKITLHDFVFCIAGGKSPHQTEPSQHLYKHTLPWGYRRQELLHLPFSFNFLALFCLLLFPYKLFYKLSLLLTDVTAFPLYFILSSPSVTSQTQLLLVFSWVSQSCWTWDGANVPLPHLLSFYTISSTTSLPCEGNDPSVLAEHSNHLRNGWNLFLKRICMLQFILAKYA